MEVQKQILGVGEGGLDRKTEQVSRTLLKLGGKTAE